MEEEKKITEMTNEELLLEAKKMKTVRVYDAFFFGFLAGCALYSTFYKGITLFTLLPLIYLPIAGKNKRKKEELHGLIEEKGLGIS